MSKAMWGIVVVVDLVLDLALGRVVHAGYCADCLHYPHYHHHHPHLHPRQPLPISVRCPNWVEIERLTINEDSHDGACAHPRSTGYGMLDFLPPQGTCPQKRWGREAVPHKRSCHRRPFDQRLGRSSLGLPYPKLLGWCRGTLDCWWSYRPRPGTRIVRLRRPWGSLVGHACSSFMGRGPGVPFIDVFDSCGSILCLLTGDSTSVVDRATPGVNPAPNTHKDAWWRDERSLNCLSTSWETIAATRCAPPINPGGS